MHRRFSLKFTPIEVFNSPCALKWQIKILSSYTEKYDVIRLHTKLNVKVIISLKTIVGCE